MLTVVGRLLVAAALTTSILTIGGHDPTAPDDSSPIAFAAATGTSAYVPVDPCRLGDTRRGIGFVRVDDSTATIDTDACGIPDDASSLVVTTTIVAPRERGYLVTYPSGRPLPTAATLNWRAFQTRANTATVAIGADRRIAVHRNGAFDDGAVVLDVVGAFVPTDSSTSGRFRAEPTAQRLLDTRSATMPTAGSVLSIPLPRSVPADATALAVNVTSVRNEGVGYVSASPAGSGTPDTSILNVDAPGQFRAAATIVPVTPDGFEVYVSTGTHVVVDVTGWFTGDSAADSDAGLFVAVNPARLYDTRTRPDPIHRAGTIDVALPQLGVGIAAATYSVTMIAPGSSGYITTHAAGTPRGPTSSGYGEGGDLTAQFGVVGASSRGVAVYADAGAEVTFDLLGYFTGTPAPITAPSAPVNVVDRQRVVAIGDSTLAGIDRNQAWAQLRGADIDLRARSCRRLVRASCSGREGPVPPPNVLQELATIPFGAFDMAVIMTGYNDGPTDVARGIPQILDAARAKGIRHVIWLTYSREFAFDKGASIAGKQIYAAHNTFLRDAANVTGDLTAVEWSAVARQAPFWHYADGIHLDRYGGHGAADFISRAIAHVAGQRCPMPQFPGAANVGVCPDPGFQPPIDIARLYGI
ncbi:MAG: SGNH/GDSL hydrolase family protein [Ilumatobacter sp.]|uniref:SGNH/GDSL hydrolase family protein n=1 Tax=Ilumatobacter sp. TaxID=1967498 RepID=UPI00329A6350